MAGCRPAGLAVAGTAIAVVLIGCGADDGPAATGGNSGSQVDLANSIDYPSVGTTAELDCADGKSVNIGGSNNTLTITGTCASVNVAGSDNRITIEAVDDDIRVGGINNTINYRTGDPAIDSASASNAIRKG